jgi:hypothetical protein
LNRPGEIPVKDTPVKESFLPEAPEIPGPMWRPFTSEAGHFQIDFPGKPSLQETNAPFLIGKVNRFTNHVLFENPKVSFWADYFDLTPELARQCPPERCFQWFQDRLVGQLPNGKVLAEKALALGPHPGRECRLAGGNVEVSARMYTVPGGPNTRLFLLMVKGTNVRPAAKDVATFFDSFSYKEP